MLEARIYQHRTQSLSHVYQHISNCNTYNEILKEKYGAAPNGNSQREFIKNHFTILEKNLYNYHARTTHEGLMITLLNPNLNQQVFHKSMTFVCECASSKTKEPLTAADTVGT